MKSGILLTLSALAISFVGDAPRLRADEPKIPTRVIFYRFPVEEGQTVSAPWFGLLIQAETFDVLECKEPGSSGAQPPEDPASAAAYLQKHCGPPGWEGAIAHQKFFQPASDRFILTTQVPGLRGTIENKTGLISGTETLTISLRDPSSILITYAFIVHPEGTNPAVQTNHMTILRTYETVIPADPIREKTEIIRP